jgi:formate hydrogenlyase subunit 3/multisubunit Na+/H+ antiporter MnhD subunit
MTDGLALAATLAVPLVMLAACAVRPLRAPVFHALPLAALPGLWGALAGPDQGAFVIARQPVELLLELGRSGRVLLLVASILWSLAALYATTYLRESANRERFTVCWLLGVAGCLGAFVAADMATLYLCLALLTLGAGGLVFHEETPVAKRSASIYLGLALGAETLVLIAMVMLAVELPRGNLLIRDASALLPSLPHHDLILAFLVIGFGLKAGLFPLHVWMPLAHAAAPAPASAVLSGAVVKVGILGLGRFVPFDVSQPEWGVTITAIGLFTAVYGALVGLTQAHPKAVLAYSSVSQMGLIAAVAGMGVSAADPSAAVAAAYYASHHVLVKGALFLAVGLVAMCGPRRLWWIVLPTLILALGLGGLPLTGGALAKYAVKGPLGEGLAGTLANVSAATTTMLVLHFVHRLRRSASDDRDAFPPAALLVPWALLVIASVGVPWWLYLSAPPGTLDNPLAPKALLAASVPMIAGAAALLALERWAHGKLPRIPQGDIAVVIAPAMRLLSHGATMLAALDDALRRWPAAGLALVALVVLFGWAMSAGPV